MRSLVDKVFTLTPELILAWEGTEVRILDKLYVLEASKFLMDNKPKVQHLDVLGYRRVGEAWEPDQDLTVTLFVGDVVEAKEFEWAQFM